LPSLYIDTLIQDDELHFEPPMTILSLLEDLFLIYLAKKHFSLTRSEILCVYFV